jgi:hypothetical protein
MHSLRSGRLTLMSDQLDHHAGISPSVLGDGRAGSEPEEATCS